MHEDDACFKHKVDRSAQSYTLYAIVYYIYYITRILWVNIPISSREICLSMRSVNAWKLRDLRVIFKNHIPNMDHKHFQSAKRPFSVIFNSKPTNQVIRYKHEAQVSAKIMLGQKADFLKFDSN